MKNSRLRLFAVLCCFSLSLLACGGGSSSSTPADTSGSAAVTTLKITDTVIGTGAMAGANNVLSVHYTGWLYDQSKPDFRGAKFDSSIDRGAQFVFTLGIGSVIKGWDQGIVGMRVGGKRTLIIPSALAYGTSANGTIPANAALVFDVELFSVK